MRSSNSGDKPPFSLVNIKASFNEGADRTELRDKDRPDSGRAG